MEDENNFQDANQDAGGQEAAVAVADQNQNVPAGGQNIAPAGNVNAVQQQGPHVVGAQVQGGQGIPPPPIQNPVGAIRIICSPWDGDIDLSTKDGKTLWKVGTYPLETPFTGTGKDVGRFLSEVSIRVRTCKWEDIITFGERNLLTQHGQISKTEVEAAKALRESTVPTTLAQARPSINARMMFHFVYGSISASPKKLLTTKMVDIGEDGPLLLKMVLLNTFIATKASLFTIKEDFYALNLKQFKFNVVTLHTEIRSMIVELTASGVTMDETDVVLLLFRAYNTGTNDEFKSSIQFWKNEWNSGAFTVYEDLMLRAEAKYDELKKLGTWGKRGAKDEQIVALTAKIDKLTKDSKKPSQDKDKTGDKDKKTAASSTNKKRDNAWKKDRSLSSSTTLKKDNKEYKWCTGPGHGGIGMWVMHVPGSCTEKLAGTGSNNNNNSGNDGTVSRAALTASLKAKGLSDDEVQSKVEAIIAVMDN